jgi:hypothetical protein
MKLCVEHKSRRVVSCASLMVTYIMCPDDDWILVSAWIEIIWLAMDLAGVTSNSSQRTYMMKSCLHSLF